MESSDSSSSRSSRTESLSSSLGCYAMELEGEVDEARAESLQSDEYDSDEGPYQDDPIADDDYVAGYNQIMRERVEKLQILTRRMEGSEALSAWCQCGKCNVELLVAVDEFQCCQEIDGCLESLGSKRVVEDVNVQGKVLNCITEHPGFAQICLFKWPLLHCADKYKSRKHKRKYRQTGTENEYLRSISYREFTRLAHGYLGNKKRIPLPACAYHLIRTTFPSEKEEITGYHPNSSEEEV